MVSLTDQSKRRTRSVKGRDTYTGTMRGGVVGQYYYRHRVCGAEVGRFISRDPAGADINLCRYRANNPLVRVDHSGLDWDVDKGGGRKVRAECCGDTVEKLAAEISCSSH